MSTAENDTAQLLSVAEIGGRGRALVAAQPLRGGQVILRDSPLLLYSALSLTKQASSSSSTFRYCDHCFRVLQSTLVPCSSCSHHAFCSSTCHARASESSHTPWACQTLARLIDSGSFHCLSLDRQVQARFLIAAYNLSIVSPANFQILLSLQGRDGLSDDTALAVQLLHPLIASACVPPPVAFPCGFSPELSASLLSKDKVNAFGLMEPVGGSGERSVRAYGIYPRASFFNHDCLPNACRFDYVDTATATDGNTDIIVRMIHDVPQGREICLSYFPVNLNYAGRQRRLSEDYGFTCDCDRCKVEANWSDEENDNGEGDDGVEEMEDEGDEEMEGSDGDDGGDNKENDFPHAYFFVKYMCGRESCGGTLAPLPPQNGASSDVMECNVCGQMKKDDQEDDAEDMDQ